MKLLIVTQVVDKNHPVLGFFHRWIEEFAKHCEKVSVIALELGEHDLPDNVSVYSLGKETGQNKVKYLLNFYKLIWRFRRDYDHVFVHMNQIYVILGGFLWRTWSKKVGFWYAHGTVSVSLKIAILITNIAFTSTTEGLRIESKKRIIVGQGIDTKLFTSVPKESSDKLRLITVGRISESKNLYTLLRSCLILKKSGTNFVFRIVGTSTTQEEREYESEMKKLTVELGIEDNVVWVGALKQDQLPKELQQSEVFIHDGATNSLDKALLEAVLCGCIVISSNPAYGKIAKEFTPKLIFNPRDESSLHLILSNLKSFDISDVIRLENYVRKNFSINRLISGILGQYT